MYGWLGLNIRVESTSLLLTRKIFNTCELYWIGGTSVCKDRLAGVAVLNLTPNVEGLRGSWETLPTDRQINPIVNGKVINKYLLQSVSS